MCTDLSGKHKHRGLGAVSHHVDDTAISNHDNLPSQAFVAPQASFASVSSRTEGVPGTQSARLEAG